uniref:Auxilin n=1 Tax=Rhizophora mucronata TaxID=61149 RepID=A0A2P2Q2Z5_RHIMU
MEYQRVSPAAAFSKKLSKGRSLTRKHAYDGVFGGGLGSRVEDYKEIFGGYGASSIPILDVAELNEKRTWADVRSSQVDYSNIFSGFGDAEFAVPYDQLFEKPKKAANISPPHARASGEARFPSAGSEHPDHFKEKQVPAEEASFQLFDGVMQFNVSYHKTNLGSKDEVNGTAHIAQLNANPGYTCLIDETNPLHKTEGGKPVHSALYDAHIGSNFNDGLKKWKPQRKTVSGPQPGGSTAEKRCLHKYSAQNRSISNDIPFSAFEIDPDSHPSKMPQPSGTPSNLANSKGSSRTPAKSKLGVSRYDASGTANDHSAPFSDEELDVNSAAAASAAAVRKAIEEAQAKIKIAKELMERRKSVASFKVEKPIFSSGSKTEKKGAKMEEKVKKSEEKELQEKYAKENSSKQVFSGFSKCNVTNESQVNPELGDENNPSLTQSRTREAGQTRNMVVNSAQMHCGPEEADDGKAPKEFLEFSAIGTNDTTPFSYRSKGREKIAADEYIEMLKEHGKKLKAWEEAPQQENVTRELKWVGEAFEWDKHRDDIKSAQEVHQEENRQNFRVPFDSGECDQTSKVTYEQVQYEGNLKVLEELEENENFNMQKLDEVKYMEDPDRSLGQVNIHNKQNQTHTQEAIENRSGEGCISVDNKRLEIENEMGHKEVWGMVDCEDKQEEGWNYEEKEKKQNDIPKGSEGKEAEEMLAEAHKQGIINTRFNGLKDKDAREKKLGDYAGMEEKTKNLEEDKENEKLLENGLQMNQTEKIWEGTYQGRETEKINPNIHPNSDDEKKTEVSQGQNLKADEDGYEHYETENLGGPCAAYQHERPFEGAEATEAMQKVEDNGRSMESTEVPSETQETGKKSKLVEDANALAVDENFGTSGLAQNFLGPNGIKMQTVHVAEALSSGRNGAYLGETDFNLEHKQNEDHATEFTRVSGQEKDFEEVSLEFDIDDEDVHEPEVDNENNVVDSLGERGLDDGIESNTLNDADKDVEEVNFELEEIDEDDKEPTIATTHGEDEDDFESSHFKTQMDSERDVEGSLHPCVFEENEQVMEICPEEKTSQNTETKQDDPITLKMEENEVKDTLQKEADLDIKHAKIKEEIKERDVEKEKERIAVERAIREARERAFAEAKERAERAAADRAAKEVHKRTMSEPRKKFMASDPANHKSDAEKASMEAKLKAERAAVERATAEARGRLLEKALSENARNCTDEFLAEISGASRDNGTKYNEQQFKETGNSSSSRCSNSVHNEVLHSTNRSRGEDNESGQMFRSTSEIHQRTAERAAKALAEKNMRDLLAQKEQAERNRLAETLDAEIKRWSSGKERNLRALLSTLQYILGPESGWQPVALTNLISTTAVKKAYRKATLCVHPDKLQQRGASIQQKYTCEKVFDLLKEAWNRFSAEER